VPQERDHQLETPSTIGQRRTWFDRVAEVTASFVSRAAFFAISPVVVLLWIPLIAVFESVDTWQLVINTATSVIAFLLIALLTNTERRGDRALHRKFDVLAVAVAEVLEHEDDERLRGCAEELRAAVKLEQQI
jgi:low affinity Fe/Cu permease